MREARFGPLTVRLAGGTDRQGGGGGPLVVLLHGFGAPGADLVPLWREVRVPGEVRFAFPEAPIELDIAGLGPTEARAWWLIDVERFARAQIANEVAELTREVPPGLAEARQSVVEMLEALESELGVDRSRVVLGGFSQGAMLALDVALHLDRPPAGLALMSATLIARDEWLARLPARAGLRVVQSHGRADPLLPFFVAEELRDAMLGAGLDVRFVAFNGGHEISGSVLDELGAFLGRVVA